MSPVCEAFWDYGPSEPGPLSHESGNCIAMPPGCALPGSAQNQSGKFRLARSQPESQRDSVAKPRVGESASLPWVIVPQISQPHRGCGQTSLLSLDRGMAATALRLGLLVEREPRVAAARQPWALSHNLFGIVQMVAHPPSKIRVRCCPRVSKTSGAQQCRVPSSAKPNPSAMLQPEIRGCQRPSRCNVV